MSPSSLAVYEPSLSSNFFPLLVPHGARERVSGMNPVVYKAPLHLLNQLSDFLLLSPLSGISVNASRCRCVGRVSFHLHLLFPILLCFPNRRLWRSTRYVLCPSQSQFTSRTPLLIATTIAARPIGTGTIGAAPCPPNDRPRAIFPHFPLVYVE